MKCRPVPPGRSAAVELAVCLIANSEKVKFRVILTTNGRIMCWTLGSAHEAATDEGRKSRYTMTFSYKLPKTKPSLAYPSIRCCPVSMPNVIDLKAMTSRCRCSCSGPVAAEPELLFATLSEIL